MLVKGVSFIHKERKKNSERVQKFRIYTCVDPIFYWKTVVAENFGGEGVNYLSWSYFEKLKQDIGMKHIWGLGLIVDAL